MTAAATVAVDKIRGQRSVFLVRQERFPSRSIGWEIPAGRPEEGESPLEASQRELREEAGITARLWQPLPQQVEFVGRSNARSDLHIAADIEEVEAQHDLEEVITDRGWFSEGSIQDMLLSGEINAAHTMGGIAVTFAFLDRNRDHDISMLVN
jgi:ADP-ribose pyrophosphatase